MLECAVIGEASIDSSPRVSQANNEKLLVGTAKHMLERQEVGHSWHPFGRSLELGATLRNAGTSLAESQSDLSKIWRYYSPRR